MSTRDDRYENMRATLDPKAKRDALLGAMRDPSARPGGARFEKARDAAGELSRLDWPETDADAERFMAELAVAGLLEKYKIGRGAGMNTIHAYLWALLEGLADGAFR